MLKAGYGNKEGKGILRAAYGSKDLQFEEKKKKFYPIL